jgi:hypothetical protein
MKMVKFDRNALSPSRRYLPLPVVAGMAATLEVATVTALQDTPLVATRPAGRTTLDTARAGRLPAAGVANISCHGRHRPSWDGVVLDQACFGN